MMDGKFRMGKCTCLPEDMFKELEHKTFFVNFGGKQFEFGFQIVPISENHDKDLRRFRAEGFIDKTYKGIFLTLEELRWKVAKKGRRVYEYFVYKIDRMRYFPSGVPVDEIVTSYAAMIQRMRHYKDFQTWRRGMNPPRWKMPFVA